MPASFLQPVLPMHGHAHVSTVSSTSRHWVFRKGNSPALCRLLSAFHMFAPTQQSVGPSLSSPAFWAGRHPGSRPGSEAFCSDLVQQYYSPLRFLAPHRPELRSRLYPHLPPGGFRPMFVFPVAHPFVCECHNISTIPSVWTIPGLPGSQTLLPHRVARTHLGTMDWNPCAFAIIVLARPLSIFGRPVHPRDCSLRLQPGGSPQALQTPPRGGRPALRCPIAPAREALPPRLDIDPGPRVEWDSNPPETPAARHTLWPLLTSPAPSLAFRLR